MAVISYRASLRDQKHGIGASNLLGGYTHSENIWRGNNLGADGQKHIIHFVAYITII